MKLCLARSASNEDSLELADVADDRSFLRGVMISRVSLDEQWNYQGLTNATWFAPAGYRRLSPGRGQLGTRRRVYDYLHVGDGAVDGVS